MKPNTLYYGDCLEVMREWQDHSVDLIYLDPPFNSNANYNIIFGKAQDKTRKDDLAQMTAFIDTWQWDAPAAERVKNICNAVAHPAHYAIKGLNTIFQDGNGMLAYLSYMAERLAEMHRLLKDSGSIYLHCDPTASHYLKIIMDDIFGARNFRNEIIWGYRTGGISKKRWGKKHDVLFYYAKNKEAALFNPQKETIYYDKPFFGATAPDSAGKYPVEVIKRDVWDSGSQGDDETTKPVINVSKERLGYRTQKPLALLKRIVAASSNQGDIVLDPFCGCGTTIEAAHLLKRRWIGIDISAYAIEIVRRERMKDLAIELAGVPKDLKGAVDFANQKPFDFEKWAVTRIPNFVPNDVQRGDGGVDGRALIFNGAKDDNLCIAQVKGGAPNVDSLRAFFGKIGAEREAAIGIFITLHQWDTPTVRKCVAKADTLQIGGSIYNRLLMYSIDEYFQGVEPKLPPLAHPRTGKATQHDLMDAAGK